MDVLVAFATEAQAVEASVRRVDPSDWDLPGLGEWTIAELVAHLVRAADRVAHYLDQPVAAEAPVVDRVGYFRFDGTAAAAGVAERSRQDAARYGAETLPDVFAAAWRECVAAVEGQPALRLLPTFMGPMHLEEYLATRVLELTVHHMDLCRALGRSAQPTAEGLAVTTAILAALLDGPMPAGRDGVPFVLAATGREPHPDPRLPLLH